LINNAASLILFFSSSAMLAAPVNRFAHIYFEFFIVLLVSVIVAMGNGRLRFDA
jgi:hypothetical protein